MTKRNYQIIKMAEREMNQENGEENPQLTPEMVQQMLDNEQNELNEAIKQSLIDEDEKRRPEPSRTTSPSATTCQ